VRTLKEVMHGYLMDDQETSPRVLNEMPTWLPSAQGECPITPSEGSWETVSDPTRYQKKFELGNHTQVVGFINEVLAYQNSRQHHGKITIDHDSITIEVYTHDVNTVTELDQEYTHEIDNIYLDIQYSGYETGQQRDF
jgi:pterin-4a-carbinolamine dehydratase